jgi:hypothetical protein
MTVPAVEANSAPENGVPENEVPEFDDRAGEYQATRARKPRPRPTKFRVKHYNPDSDNDRVLHSHEDKDQARRFVVQHHPRGREVYLEHPDGYREHYSADLAFQGSDPWQEFTEDED